MDVKVKRMLIWTAMSMAGAGLVYAMDVHSASGALISAAGLLAGIALLQNDHLLLNRVKDISAAAGSVGYDRRSRFYSRAAVLILAAGLVVALVGH